MLSPGISPPPQLPELFNLYHGGLFLLPLYPSPVQVDLRCQLQNQPLGLQRLGSNIATGQIGDSGILI